MVSVVDVALLAPRLRRLLLDLLVASRVEQLIRRQRKQREARDHQRDREPPQHPSTLRLERCVFLLVRDGLLDSYS